jgi:hypothetical protein
MALRHLITGLAIVAVTAAPALAQDNKDHRGDARPAQQDERARPAPQVRQNERAVPRAAEPQRQQVQRQQVQRDQVQRQPVQRQEIQNQQIQRQQFQRQQVQREQVQRQQVQPEQVQHGNVAVRRDEAASVPNRGVAVVRPQEGRPQYNGGRYDAHYNNGYAAPRHYVFTSPRIVRPTIVQVLPYRPYVYRPSWSIGVYYGTGGYYPYGYTPDGYFNPIPGHYYGGLRITGAPRQARVFADGYYVGIVDDFDGIFQHMNLEAGPHHIELQLDGYAPVAFDVNIRPEQTITFRADQSFFQPVGN